MSTTSWPSDRAVVWHPELETCSSPRLCCGCSQMQVAGSWRPCRAAAGSRAGLNDAARTRSGCDIPVRCCAPKHAVWGDALLSFGEATSLPDRVEWATAILVASVQRTRRVHELE